MFSDRLKELRKSSGLTQIQFAEKFNIAKGTIGMWESGKREPDFDTAQRIADFFGVTVDYLLGRSSEKTPAKPGEREFGEQELKVAFFRGADPTLTDEEIDDMWEDAKDLRDVLIIKKRRERNGK